MQRNDLSRWPLFGAMLLLLFGGWFASSSPLATAQEGGKAGAAPAREAYAELPGVRLWFKDSGGTGIPVVFLHAATGSTDSWEHQIPAFTSAGYRFITFDRRGTGRTVAESADPQPSAADDLQALMDYLHIDRFHLVGTAAGGFTALDYALSYQQHLRSLVVANSIGAVQDADYVAMVGRLRPLPQFESLPIDFQELGPSYRVANPEGTKRWLEIQRAGHSGPAVRQPMRNKITFAALETLRVPALFIAGDADLIAPPPILRFFTDRVKNSQSMVIPEAGHSSYWEQPEIFNKDVLQFIRKH